MNLTVCLFLVMLSAGSQQEGILDRSIELFGKGEFREANKVLSAAGDSAEVHFWLGRTFLKIRKWDKAVKEMEQAVALEPSNAMYHLWLGRAYGARAENRIFGFNDARRVLREFMKAGELDPSNITVRFDLLEFYAQAPGIVGGSKDKAWMEAEAISKLNPVRGFTARATIYEHEKKWKMAEKEYVQATLEYPSDADAFKDLAQFLLGREDFEGALSNAGEALELDSFSDQSLFIQAVSSIQLGQDLEKAREILLDLTEKSLGDSSPSFEDVYYWLGIHYFNEGEKEKSKDAFESVLVYNPDYKKTEDYLSRLR